jgi:hypothetical protein
MMALTRAVSVLRALIEETLRRPRQGQPRIAEPGDVQTMLRVLKTLTMDKRVIILADSSRFADDFRKVTGIVARYVWLWDQVQGLDNLHVIQLHTGPRSARQQELLNDVLEILKTRQNIDFWHIGEWR